MWTAYYVIAEAANPIPNLAAAIMCMMSAAAINLAVIAPLLLTKLRWVALGYFAAMALNGIGLFLLDGYYFVVMNFVSSFPFYLPSNFRL